MPSDSVVPAGHRVLLFARHGETDWNLAGRWQGQTDVPLNATGHAQARRLAEVVKRAGVRSVAASDLSRARQTAEIVARVLGVDLAHVDPDLRERGFGRFEGLTRAECELRFPDDWTRYAADPRHPPPDGEPQPKVIARMRAAAVRIAASLEGPVLVVTHGGAIRALVGHARGAPIPPVPNGAVYRAVLHGEEIVEAALLEELAP